MSVTSGNVLAAKFQVLKLTIKYYENVVHLLPVLGTYFLESVISVVLTFMSTCLRVFCPAKSRQTTNCNFMRTQAAGKCSHREKHDVLFKRQPKRAENIMQIASVEAVQRYSAIFFGHRFLTADSSPKIRGLRCFRHQSFTKRWVYRFL